jgi:prepilin-type N-terminal cleavage/methylation domain-containing protein
MSKKIHKHGFTIVEILVVVAIIALLAAFLLVALGGSQDAAKTAKATVKFKEIGSWMQLWSGDNNNRVLPSQFDFSDEAASGSSIRVRRDEHAEDDNPNDDITRGQYQGTWADILWTDNKLYQTYGLDDTEEGEEHLLWQFDSPDNNIYEMYSSFDHPFRSMFNNTRGLDVDYPGYFAANDFFDSRSDNDADGETSSSVDRYYTYSMIHAPARSIYLVDSMLGETISDEVEAWDGAVTSSAGGPISHDTLNPTGEVDFRYGDECMVLTLDGSIVRLAPWSERGPMLTPPTGADISLFGRGYRVHQLTKRKPVE